MSGMVVWNGLTLQDKWSVLKWQDAPSLILDTDLNMLIQTLEYENIQDEKIGKFSRSFRSIILEIVCKYLKSIRFHKDYRRDFYRKFADLSQGKISCEKQTRTVQISYSCVLTVSQFTQNRELKQPYRDVPLNAVRKASGVPLNDCSVFSRQIHKNFPLPKTNFWLILQAVGL